MGSRWLDCDAAFNRNRIHLSQTGVMPCRIRSHFFSPDFCGAVQASNRARETRRALSSALTISITPSPSVSIGRAIIGVTKRPHCRLGLGAASLRLNANETVFAAPALVTMSRRPSASRSANAACGGTPLIFKNLRPFTCGFSSRKKSSAPQSGKKLVTATWDPPD